ncbi:hypothetical protein ACFSQP_09915 [Bizionia sediminis]|uniref:YhhN-like protein n=1 Tax=Bizionia sediminis TaxID=1737064 RepID=A0ABW5KW38_9FLAO
MKKTDILIFFIIAFCVIFTLLQINGKTELSGLSKALIAPLFALMYFINVEKKTRYFSLFLIAFSAAELFVFVEYFSLKAPQINLDAVYVIGNLFYMLSYVFLIIEVSKTINFRKALKNYIVHILILMALNIYIVYVLLTIVFPSFPKGAELFIMVELVYNIIMLLLLSISLISYFYNDNKKTLFLFFGSICIVFSEVIQIAYYYVAEEQGVLNIVQTLLFLMAFCFFYVQSKVKNEKVELFV